MKIVSPRDIESLILLGRNSCKPDQHLLLKEIDYLYYLQADNWKELTNHISDTDLVFIYKGLVLSDQYCRGAGGSVAGAIQVYDLLRKRGLDRDNVYADFGLRHCSNPWIPFGKSYYGVRTIEAYSAYEKEKAEKSAVKAYQYSRVLDRVKGRKRVRASAIAELRKLSREERGQIRVDLLRKYESNTFIERLKVIAEDEIYPPEYYPREWVMLPITDLARLPPDLVSILYDKLSTKTKGCWKRFANELRKLDMNNLNT